MLEPNASPIAAPLPALAPVDEVQRRLESIFPASFPDRSILVGRMAAHVVFVFLYGGFIEGSGRLLRPSLVYFSPPSKRGEMPARSVRHGWRPHSNRAIDRAASVGMPTTAASRSATT